jgi:hypothetical protein
MSHPPMFGTFTVTVDGGNDLCRGPDTLQQRHDTARTSHRSLPHVPSRHA